MTPQKQLEVYLKQQPESRREEAMHRIMRCVGEILEDYHTEYESASDALEAAIQDSAEYAQLYGEHPVSSLIDQFVVQQLYFKTLN